MQLSDKKCVPCEAGTPPMRLDDIQKYQTQLKTHWELLDRSSQSGADPRAKKLRHEFKFKSFKESISFVNKVADIAEHEGHHPDIYIYYTKVIIELWTHANSGLSENDFIVARKIEMLL